MLLIRTIYASVWCSCLEWCVVYFLWLPPCGSAALTHGSATHDNFINFLSAWTYMSITFIMMTPCTTRMLRYRRVPTLHFEHAYLAFEAKNSKFHSMHTFWGSSLYHRIQNLVIYQSFVNFNCVVINHQK